MQGWVAPPAAVNLCRHVGLAVAVDRRPFDPPRRFVSRVVSRGRRRLIFVGAGHALTWRVLVEMSPVGGDDVAFARLSGSDGFPRAFMTGLLAGSGCHDTTLPFRAVAVTRAQAEKCKIAAGWVA
jgi:hypothetical protein